MHNLVLPPTLCSLGPMSRAVSEEGSLHNHLQVHSSQLLNPVPADSIRPTDAANLTSQSPDSLLTHTHHGDATEEHGLRR
jgi:hypothetical protein